MHCDDGEASPLNLGWVNGWSRTARGLELETLHWQERAWMQRQVPASWLFNRRVFEPTIFPLDLFPTRNLRVRIADLTQLSPLLQPGALVRPLVRPARNTRHAIYVTQDEESKVYLPAALLLRELWLWAQASLDALLTPNGLELYLGPGQDDKGVFVQARGPLAAAQQSDTALRRLSWLAQCDDARKSWSSALTHAFQGDIRVRMPRASLEAWGWGVDISGGTLVAELSSVDLRFELPEEGGRILMGQAERRCPPPPLRRHGLVTF